MTTFGQPRLHLTQCASTNDAARNWAQNRDNPAPAGALVTADFQTAGRGQRGHQWQAGFGQSALMSFVYRLPMDAEALPLGLVTALAVAEALTALGFSPKIKWPNDILLDQRKVAGILVEAADGVAILGIGINVSQARFVGSETFPLPPTSLSLVSGAELPVSSVINAVCAALTTVDQTWHQGGFAPIVQQCRDYLTVGAKVRQGDLVGTLTGLTAQGAAQVCLPDGTFVEWATVS